MWRSRSRRKAEGKREKTAWTLWRAERIITGARISMSGRHTRASFDMEFGIFGTKA